MSASHQHVSAHGVLIWLRRDLRLHDHAALYHGLRAAQKTGAPAWCVFVFDTAILQPLLDQGCQRDRRVAFIHACITELDQALQQWGSRLIVLHGAAQQCIPQLAQELGVHAVFANRDYEPAAMARDAAVAAALKSSGIEFHDSKDQVIFERDEILTATGTPYSVFTPYRNAWQKRLNSFYLQSYPVDKYRAAFVPLPPAKADTHYARFANHGIPSLTQLGFDPHALEGVRLPTGIRGGLQLFEDFQARIEQYHQTRDYPAIKGPSYLSTHLRFGTISIRTLAQYAVSLAGKGAETWLSELIWREFYQQILWHHPRVVTEYFKAEYVALKWDEDDHAQSLFAAWCIGKTGYPLVDAAMRQLLQTGYMHNRLRMVSASFLTKDLGIDWRRGEAWFAQHLNDYDLAANNGGWQWAASTGCDAQPYFRIFNPITQSEKFDPKGLFIRRYVPEVAGFEGKHIHAPWHASKLEQEAANCIVGQHYPAPIVDHAEARERTLLRFGKVRAVRGAT